MKRPASLLLFFAVSLLSACGFQLRGAAYYDNLPFKSVYLVLPDNSLFGNELARNFEASDKTRVVNTPQEADALLEVMAENKSKTFLSLNVQGRAREYTLTYEVTFRLLDAQKRTLMAPTRVGASRTLIYNELLALGRESEEEMLYREMQSDLVQQVLRRLGALKVPTSVKPPSSAAPVRTTPAREPHAVAP
jgi:LPS-assembly lipoprotein